MVFEARAPEASPPVYELPPALSPEASARLVTVEVAVDGATKRVDCASVDLFDCVRDFCTGHSINPAVQCMASLMSSFQAQVL